MDKRALEKKKEKKKKRAPYENEARFIPIWLH